MNNMPNPGRRPQNGRGRPSQSSGPGRPPQNPNARRRPPRPDARANGQPPRNNPQRPPQRHQQPYPPRTPEPDYVRRRREIERRQEEARRQAMLDRKRREKQRRKAARARRFRQGLVILGGRLLIFAIILIILCGLTGLMFLLFFQHAPDKPDTSGTITYTYGGSEVRETPFSEAFADGIVYICFNDLADYLGMMESGSAAAMKFILPMSEEIPATAAGTGTEEMITFPIDGLTVEINGQTAQLDIPNILRGTEVWVSSTFLTEYMNNLSYQYNERKSTVLISRIVDEESSNEEENKTVYLPVSFKLKNSSALAPLPEEDSEG